MREIKFRAWSNVNKKMTTCNCLELKNGQIVSHKDESTGEWWEDSGYYKLMQYTGLKDKNGKDIYEGDRTQDKHVLIKGVDEFGEVVFMDGKFRVRMPKVGRSGYNYFDLINCLDDIETIGHIYENPESLKKEDDNLSSCCNAQVLLEKCLDCGDNCVTNKEDD